MKYLSYLCMFCLALMLSAPAIKARFYISDVFVYYLPFLVFAGSTLAFNLLYKTKAYFQFVEASAYGLILSAAVFSFAVGGFLEQGLLIKILLNCGLAATIVMYPWSRGGLHMFFLFMAILGSILALYTMMYLGSNTALEDATDQARQGYITVSVVMGFGCLAGLYLIFEKPHLVYYALFATSWIGLALGRGRGALLFCVVFTSLYIAFMLMQRKRSVGFKVKAAVFFFVGGFIPIVFNRLMSLDQNQGRWARLLNDFASEVDDGGRGALVAEAMRLIKASPLYGNGLGEYMMFGGHPHNLFLQFGVDGGMIAMALVFVFVLRVCYLGFRSLGSYTVGDLNITCAAFGFFLFIFANMLKSGDAYLGREWFICAALPIVVHMLQKYTRKPN